MQLGRSAFDVEMIVLTGPAFRGQHFAEVTLAHAQCNLPKHVAFLDSLVCFGGASEIVSGSNWDLEIPVDENAVETFKFANPGNCVVREHLYSFSFSRYRLDAVWICDPTAITRCIQTLLKS